MRTEADRKAYNKYLDEAPQRAEAEAKRIAINEWLGRNPQIGQLNGDKFYYISNGEAIEIEALTKLN